MNRIRILREEKGWTQAKLGNLLNVKDSAISKYETEKIPLTAETLKRLSEIFDVSVDYILGLSPVRKPDNTSFAKPKILEIQDLEELSNESREELKQYIQFLKIKEDMNKGKNETSSALEKNG